MTARLEVRDIVKQYPGTRALRGVSISFEGGKVHALLGKNGAGKSTMVKIIAGAVTPTSGQVFVDGNEVSFSSPANALAQGIATVYQEMSLVPGLTVAENILFGRLPKKGPIIDWPRVYSKAGELVESLGLRLDVRAKVDSLGIAQQQVVEIVKAMSYEPKVLMLDEPTSSLAHHETQSLFRLIRQLTARGVAIIYISHRLQELREIADTMSVLRDGELIGTSEVAGATPAAIARMMFGETVQRSRPEGLTVGDETVLEVQNLGWRDAFHDVSFQLKRGEILGIAGMLGSGRSELLLSLFGAQPPTSGKVFVEGKEVRPSSPHTMKHRGLALAPEDRKRHGLIQMMSTADNLCLASLRGQASAGVVQNSQQKQLIDDSVRNLQITVANTGRPVSSLSGGNQQKVVIGKWLATGPRILLFDEPTRGVDVQAKQQMFEIIWDLSRRGISSIFVSSELEELVEVCHRILVMRSGHIVGEVSPEGLSMETLLEMCMEESQEQPAMA